MTHTSAAVLIIGDEILSGKVADCNSPFLIRSLRERGIELVEARVVPDRNAVIAAAIRELSARVAYLFTTGGIGPTHDDVTVAAAAAAFDLATVRHPEIERWLRSHYGDELNEARLRLAEVPQGAVLHATEETLPAIQVRNVFLFPGVPSLMRLSFAAVAPSLEGVPFFGEAVFLRVGETTIAALLEAVQQRHPEVAIGSYPRFEQSTYRVKITIDGRDRAAVQATLLDLTTTLEPEWIVEPPSPIR